MSKHPIDYLIHSSLCFIAIYFDFATWFVVLFVAFLIEYEQRWQTWYINKPIWEYVRKDSLPDMIANIVGILLALFLKYWGLSWMKSIMDINLLKLFIS